MLILFYAKFWVGVAHVFVYNLINVFNKIRILNSGAQLRLQVNFDNRKRRAWGQVRTILSPGNSLQVWNAGLSSLLGIPMKDYPLSWEFPSGMECLALWRSSLLETFHHDHYLKYISVRY